MSLYDSFILNDAKFYCVSVFFFLKLICNFKFVLLRKDREHVVPVVQYHRSSETPVYTDRYGTVDFGKTIPLMRVPTHSILMSMVALL